MFTLDETTTVIDLEQLVNGDDCKCQSTHMQGCGPCTHKVVARKHSCIPSFNICQSSYDWNEKMISLSRSLHNKHCITCKRPAHECWTIIPI